MKIEILKNTENVCRHHEPDEDPIRSSPFEAIHPHGILPRSGLMHTSAPFCGSKTKRSSGDPGFTRALVCLGRLLLILTEPVLPDVRRLRSSSDPHE